MCIRDREWPCIPGQVAPFLRPPGEQVPEAPCCYQRRVAAHPRLVGEGRSVPARVQVRRGLRSQ
eukprot:5574592-Prorocentrum_lima.AAC.1